jgi:hypothetical protein
MLQAIDHNACAGESESSRAMLELVSFSASLETKTKRKTEKAE